MMSKQKIKLLAPTGKCRKAQSFKTSNSTNEIIEYDQSPVLIKVDEKGKAHNEAIHTLAKFDLSKLVTTIGGTFDKRYKMTKEYESLCLEAGVDTRDYYLMYFVNKDSRKKDILNERMIVEKSGKRKKDGTLDKRYKENRKLLDSVVENSKEKSQ
jgi:hypothetical protein